MVFALGNGHHNNNLLLKMYLDILDGPRLLALFFKVDLSFRNKNITICNVYITYIYIISIGFNRDDIE